MKFHISGTLALKLLNVEVVLSQPKRKIFSKKALFTIQITINNNENEVIPVTWSLSNLPAWLKPDLSTLPLMLLQGVHKYIFHIKNLKPHKNFEKTYYLKATID